MYIKRIFDILFSLLGLLILAPILLLTWIVVRVSSGGPVIFKQERSGLNGVPFTIYKFRTMYPEHGGSSVSVKGESRITPLGGVLRRFKLDELPELWNILKGDMSFVGPRPDMPEYTARLQGDQREILTLRPGLTSPASIKYSREEQLLSSVPDPLKYFDEVIWPDKTEMNLEYLRDRTFFGDIRLIFRTLFGIGRNL